MKSVNKTEIAIEDVVSETRRRTEPVSCCAALSCGVVPRLSWRTAQQFAVESAADRSSHGC